MVARSERRGRSTSFPPLFPPTTLVLDQAATSWMSSLSALAVVFLNRTANTRSLNSLQLQMLHRDTRSDSSFKYKNISSRCGGDAVVHTGDVVCLGHAETIHFWHLCLLRRHPAGAVLPQLESDLIALCGTTPAWGRSRKRRGVVCRSPTFVSGSNISEEAVAAADADRRMP